MHLPKRVVEDSLTTRDGAAEFGTAFHQGAERIAQTHELEGRPEGTRRRSEAVRTTVSGFKANAQALHWTEKVLVNHQLGYAGTADLLIDHAEGLRTHVWWI